MAISFKPTGNDLPISNNGMPAGKRGSSATRKYLKRIVFEGAFANVFIVYTGGAFITGMALMMGANDFEIGLLAAIPFLAQFTQLLSAYLMDRTGKRKKMTVFAVGLARQIWWLLIPLLLISPYEFLNVLLALVIISNLLSMIIAPGWLTWMSDLIPNRIRARFFGSRSAAMATSTVLASVLGGIILDYFRSLQMEGIGFAILIFFSCAFSLVALFLLKSLPDRDEGMKDFSITISRTLEPFRNPRFGKLMLVFFVWNISIGIAAAFFAPHMLSILKMTFFQISIYTSIAAVMATLLNRPWGAIVDKFGCRPVIFICGLGISLVPFIWLIPRSDFTWILYIESAYTGIVWTGFNLAAFNIPIASSPRNGRTVYLSVFAVVTGFAFFVASMLGGLIAESFSDFHLDCGGATFVNYHLLFVISGFLRLMATFLFLTFHEPRETRIPIMVHFMGYSILKRMTVGRQFLPWAHRMKTRGSS
ncbi:MAG: MFS transporter [candidate division Zixibacteria bacterium]|nr:MFS transporter [candidate division Zixibacteria bacterium]